MAENKKDNHGKSDHDHMNRTLAHIDNSDNNLTHEQMHEMGLEHNHSHSHTHDPAAIKSVLNRLSRAIGHLESVKRMVEDGRDCSDVLVQLAAVRSALNNAGLIIMQDHIDHCIVEAVQEGDQVSIEKLKKAISTFF